MLSLARQARLAIPRAIPIVGARRLMATEVLKEAVEDEGLTEAESVEGNDTVHIELPSDSFEGYMLDPPALEYDTEKSRIVKMYKNMATIRRMEMSADALYKAKKIRGFCHMSIGQEAIAVGIENAITKEDDVIESYRCHGFTYMRGASVKEVMGELMGRRCGVSLGKGGSMHMYASHFYGGNGIVGAQVPLGTGLAFAHHYRGDKLCTWTLYGDGAANQGQVAESFNMAKLWNLPVIYACENNKYGMGTSTRRSSALNEYYKRGQYIPGLKVNGMNVLATYQAARFAKDWVANGKGPLVIEFNTYRYAGHSMSDPGTSYRTREEISQVRTKRDPLAHLKQHMIDWNIASAKEVKAFDKEARKYVDSQVAEADASPEPEAKMDILFEDVYVPGSEVPILRGRIRDDSWSFKKHGFAYR